MPPSHWKRFQLNERPLLNRRDREKVFGCGITSVPSQILTR